MNPVQHTTDKLVSFYLCGNVRIKYSFGFFLRPKLRFSCHPKSRTAKKILQPTALTIQNYLLFIPMVCSVLDTSQHNKEGTNPLKWFQFCKQFSLCERRTRTAFSCFCYASSSQTVKRIGMSLKGLVTEFSQGQILFLSRWDLRSIEM